MKIMIKFIFVLFIGNILLLTGCNGEQNDETNLVTEKWESTVHSEETHDMDSIKGSLAESGNHSDVIAISFDFNRSQTHASNQYAVWIEDEHGKLIRTLMVTDFTANGGYKKREDSIPTWVEKSNPADMTEDELDAVSGATPRTGKMTYVWDGKNSVGEKVSDGTYRFFLEGTLYWSSSVLYSGSFMLGSGNTENIEVTAIYSENSVQNRDMIQNIKVEYIASDHSGSEEASDATKQKLLGGMTTEDALEYMKTTPNLVIVQVNTAEWKITPGFTGALWIPHDEIGERYDEIPTGCPVLLHCGGGIVSVPAYETLVEKRPDIPELSYIAGSPHSIIEKYNQWLELHKN